MALVVETGAGLTNANAYVAVVEVDAYASDRGITDWAALSNTAKESAILSATTYLDANFMYSGSLTNPAQALSWPRTDAYDRANNVPVPPNIVPTTIKRACMDLAVKSGTGTILLEDQPHGGAIKSEQVGPLKVEYMDGAPAATLFAVTGLIKGLLRSDSKTYGLSIKGAGNNAPQYFVEGQYQNTGRGPSPGG